MAHLDSASLLSQMLDTPDRVCFVLEDPAVIKASKTAKADLIQAGRSTINVVHEGRQSWRRSGRRRRRSQLASSRRSELASGAGTAA